MLLQAGPISMARVERMQTSIRKGADLMEREGSRDVRRVWNNSVQSCPLYRCPHQVSAQLLRVPMSLSLSQQTPDS